MTSLQIFPGLDAATEAALRSSIIKHGVLVPVAIDQNDRILDGHHRSRIAIELDVPFPTITHWVNSDAEAKEIARTLNEDRRQLPIEQRREVVADLREQGHSLRAIGNAVGVSEGQVRKDITQVRTGTQVSGSGHLPDGVTAPRVQVEHLEPERVKGTDGKSYPATKPKPEPDPAEEWFKAGDKAERERNSQFYRIRDAVKATKRIDWEKFAEQLVGMEPIDRQLLDTSASVLESAARHIRKLLEPKLEVVK